VLPLADTIALGVDPIKPSYLERKPANEWAAFALLASSAQTHGTYPQVDINPGNRLLNVINFDNPGLAPDFYPNADAAEKLNGMVTLLAAVSPAYGIVPIGFGAGFDSDNNGTLETLSMKDPRFVADKVHSRHTYLPQDIADSEIISVLIATNFTDLTRKAKPAMNPDPAVTYQKSAAVRIKGIVTRNQADKIAWPKNAGSVGQKLTDTVQGFSFAADAKYTVSNGVLSLPNITRQGTNGADALIVRVSRSDSTTERFWNIIILPSTDALPDGASLKLNTFGITDITDDAGTNTDKTLAAIGLRFGDRVSILQRLAPAYGKDLETIAGETTSFSLFYQNIPKG